MLVSLGSSYGIGNGGLTYVPHGIVTIIVISCYGSLQSVRVQFAKRRSKMLL
jgi:hypothetical protein